MIRILVNNDKIIYCNPGDNLFQVLAGNGYLFLGNCGGNGFCNKCNVQLLNTGESIKSCEYQVFKDLEIQMETKCDAVTDYTLTTSHKASITVPKETVRQPSVSKQKPEPEESYGIAIDVGTTTIAMELVNLLTDTVIGNYSIINSQISAGADVLSRIKLASEKNGLEQLQTMVCQDIAAGLCTLMSQHSEIKEHVTNCVIAGNTTMLAILAGLTTENLGRYPFEIKNPDAMYLPYDRLFGGMEEMLVQKKQWMETCLLLPNISAFIGADIAAGAAALRLNRDNNYRLLIDLGTNGELLLCNHAHGVAASTACGPAFEGCFRNKTLYGSTLFDMLALLRKRRICDASGILKEPYFNDGIDMGQGIHIDMDIIRSFQLAKSAIYSGIEILMQQMQIAAQDITEIYVSGGFGFHLNINNAVYLGLFPKEFADKIIISGNTSLAGAHLALIENGFIDKINEFKNMITTIHLGDAKGYSDLFIHNINFPDA